MILELKTSLLLLAALGTFLCMADAAERGRSTSHEMLVDGMMRSYRVYCPVDCQTQNLPLMVVLHGGLGNALEIEQRTGMNDIADNGPFVVVYPNGIEGRLTNRRTWNAGTCCGLSAYRDIDDVRFIESLIDQIKLTHAIDLRRVYMVGMSNGGMMAYRVASAIPNKIAAVIAVSSTLTVDDFDAAKDVAVLHIHGTDDRFIPIAGGVGDKSISNTAHRSLGDTVALITRARACKAPDIQVFGHGIQSSIYSCTHGAGVEIVRIQGGGHAWPGGSGRNDGHGSNFFASSYIWEFARKYSRTNK